MVKGLQYLIDQILRTQHILDLNYTVMTTLIETIGVPLEQKALWTKASKGECKQALRSCHKESQVLFKMTASLHARAVRVSQHVSGFTSVQTRPSALIPINLIS